MGWSSGSDLFIKVWEEMRKHIAKEDHIDIMMKVITMFEDADWDCEGDIIDEFPEAEEALNRLHPEWDVCDENFN